MLIESTFRAVAEAVEQAARWHPSTIRYQSEARIAGRAFDRAERQAQAVKGLPGHSRRRRTVAAALKAAEDCLSALVATLQPEALVYRANALRRATDRLGQLSDLGGQSDQASDERVVGEGPGTPLSDVLDALFPVEQGELVQGNRADQA